MDFMQIASSLGVPVAGMAFMFWAAYKIVVSGLLPATNRLIEAHVRFLAQVELELKKQTEAYGVQTNLLREISTKIKCGE